MKYSISLIFLFVSFSISAQVLEWSDLELDQTLILKQEINFMNESLTIAKGTKVVVQDIIGLPIDVELYQVKLIKCAFPRKTTEMILLEPANKTDRSIGIQLKENCILEIFVELKDLYSRSLFSKI